MDRCSPYSIIRNVSAENILCEFSQAVSAETPELFWREVSVDWREQADFGQGATPSE